MDFTAPAGSSWNVITEELGTNFDVRVVRRTKERLHDLGPPHEQHVQITGGRQQRAGDYLFRSVVASLGIEGQCHRALSSRERGRRQFNLGLLGQRHGGGHGECLTKGRVYGKQQKISNVLALRTLSSGILERSTGPRQGLTTEAGNEYYVVVCATRWYRKRKR